MRPELTLDELGRIQRGHREAFRPLVERYTPMLLALAARYAQEADREDLVQMMWMQIYNKIALYDPRRGPPGPWIWMTAYNVARQFGRRSARRRGLGTEVTPPPDEMNASENLSEEAVIELERDRRLYQAIAALPTLQREALWLRYFEALSVADTARVLRRAEGTIKASVARAIEKLPRELEVLRED